MTEFSLYPNSLKTSKLEIAKMRSISGFGEQDEYPGEFSSMIETIECVYENKEYKIEDYYKLVIESLNKDEFNITRDSEANQTKKTKIRRLTQKQERYNK